MLAASSRWLAPRQSLIALQFLAMDPIRVAISGTGRMAREVAAAVTAAGDTNPVAYVDGPASRGELAGVPLYTAAARCCAETKPAVVVDFTNAAWTPGLCDAALAAGV